MSLMQMLSGVGSAVAGYELADDIRKTGQSAATQMGDLAGQLQSDSAFKGYGVQTGLGSSTVNPDGSMNLGVGPDVEMQSLSGGLMGGAAGNFSNAAQMANMGSMNPAYAQAMGGMGVSQGMALNNQSNPAYSQAMGMYGQNAQNAAYGQAMGAQGQAMQGLSGQQQGALGASQQAMQNSMMDTGQREQDIYSRAMAMQQPGLDAMQAQQQAREFAQGRGGVRGSQFGGTAEDAATARARAQAMNAASFQAMGQAQTEMMNQGSLANQYGQLGQSAAGMQSNIGSAMGQVGAQNAQLGQAAAQGMGMLGNQQAQLGQGAAQIYGNQASNMGALGNQQAQLSQGAGGLLSQIAQGQGQLGGQMYDQSFTPMQQQLNAMQVAQGNANMAQTGQLTGTGYGAQLGLGGIQSQVNAEKTAAELFGNMFGAGMQAIGSVDLKDLF